MPSDAQCEGLYSNGRERDSAPERLKDRGRYWLLILSELLIVAAVISVIASTAALLIEPDLAAYGRNIIMAVAVFAISVAIQKRLKENWWWYNGQ